MEMERTGIIDTGHCHKNGGIVIMIVVMGHCTEMRVEIMVLMLVVFRAGMTGTGYPV